MRPTELEELDVFRADRRVGQLRRTKTGADFAYDPSIGQDEPAAAVSWAIPTSRRKVVRHGDNLPAFFAGLLPEGGRMNALVARIKTSPDDLFSLLAAVGSDCIGDVSVAPLA